MVGTIEQKLCAASNGAEFAYYQSLVIDCIMIQCKLPVKYVLQNRKISPDSVRFVQIRLRVGTNSIKLYQFGTDLL